MALEFVKSTKSSDLLIHGGSIYSRRKQLKSGDTVWECIKRRNESACNAVVKTKDGAITGLCIIICIILTMTK